MSSSRMLKNSITYTNWNYLTNNILTQYKLFNDCVPLDSLPAHDVNISWLPQNAFLFLINSLHAGRLALLIGWQKLNLLFDNDHKGLCISDFCFLTMVIRVFVYLTGKCSSCSLWEYLKKTVRHRYVHVLLRKKKIMFLSMKWEFDIKKQNNNRSLSFILNMFIGHFLCGMCIA